MATVEPTQTPTEQPTAGTTETKGPTEPQIFHCPTCASELTPVETPSGTRYRCPQCAKIVRPIEKERKGGEEEKGIAPTSVEARKFVVKELRERLDTVYGITTKKVGPIADTVEDNPQIALNPTALYWHIKQLAGQANDYQLYLFISGLFNKLREKGLLAQPTPMPVMGTPQQQPQTFPFMFPPQQQRPMGWQPFNPFMTQQPPQQQVEQFEEYSERRTRARRQAQREEEEHELRMAKIRKEIESMKPAKESSNMVTIVEPMRDDEGNLIKDGKGNIVFRKITGPSDQVRRTSGEDPELRMLTKLEKYKTVLKSDLDESKIRAIIKEEIPKEPEVEPLTEKDVKEAAREAAASVVAATREEDKEERRHKEVLSAIRSSGSSKVVEGYKTDSYRFMGQGLDRLADVVERKEPIKLVVDLVREAPPSKEVEAGAREGIFKRLGKEYVAEE